MTCSSPRRQRQLGPLGRRNRTKPSPVVRVTGESNDDGVIPMRMAIARTLLGILLVTSVGASLGACSHTWQGAKDDFHSDTGK
jgi:hypothetical protein